MAKRNKDKYAKNTQTVTQGGSVKFLFDKRNYILMGAGLLLTIIGFILMAGGKSTDAKVFDYDAVYSFRRITLATIFVLAGFILEIIAIMRKPKSTSPEA